MITAASRNETAKPAAREATVSQLDRPPWIQINQASSAAATASATKPSTIASPASRPMPNGRNSTSAPAISPPVRPATRRPARYAAMTASAHAAACSIFAPESPIVASPIENNISPADGLFVGV